MIEVIAELTKEVIHEITVDPGPVVFLVEVVQFLILAGGIWLLAKRLLVPMLERRREGVIQELDEAATAEERYAEAQREAIRIVAEAKQKAKERIREAKERAAASHEEVIAAAEEESVRIVEQARQTLKQEEDDAVATVHTKLVDLVTVATRNVLEEALSESERRDLVEKSVLSSLEELEGVAFAE